MNITTFLDESPEQLVALGRFDLTCFVIANNPGLQVPWHIRLLIEKLEAVERGEIKRLVIMMPPGHGKSTMSSVYLPAWYIGRHPERQVICASHTQELAERFGRRVRGVISSPLNEALFPGCRISDDDAAAHRFSTVAGGSYTAVGRTGALTGRRADLLIIDDPIRDREDANSAVSRQSVKDWFSEVAYTRLTPRGAIVLIMTRWHLDDLAGWLLREHAEDGWEVLCLPAIAERDEEFRREGEPLCEEWFPVPALERIKAQIGSAAFASLYGQRPTIAEGAIFGRSMWGRYDARPRFIRIVQSWDTAFKTGSENDYSVCTTWGVTATGFVLINLWRDRVPFPELKRQVAALANMFSPHVILVEDRASGQSLVQELRDGSRLPIIPVKVDTDKISRAQAVTPLVEAGRVFIPERADWLDVFLDEMAAFPVGKHDDIVDSVVQALAYVRSNEGAERDTRVIGEILDYLIAGRRRREH